MAGAIIKGSEHFYVNKYIGNGAGQKTGRFVPFDDNATISKSLVLDQEDDPVFKVSPGAGSRRKYTFSLWFKRCSIPSAQGVTTYQSLISIKGDNESGAQLHYFYPDGTIEGYQYTSSYEIRYRTNKSFEDTSRWYHFMYVVDTEQSTADDRMKVYMDGELLTMSARTNPSLNMDTTVGTDVAYGYGANKLTASAGGGMFWDGHIAEINHVDGTALTPSTFGMTDTATGKWIPKTITGVTYGSAGHRFEFANTAGQTIAHDTSGNGNNGTITNLAVSDLSTDTPTSNYAKMSHNYHAGAVNTITQGGRVMQPAGGSDDGTFFDMKFKSGKWYCEFYAHSADEVAQYLLNGIADFERYVTDGVQEIGKRTHTYGLDTANGRYFAEGSNVVTGLSPKITQNDIGGIAVDFDNNSIYFHINGTYQNSANPANGTGGLAFAPARDTVSGYYRIGQSNGTGSSGYNNLVSWNVGDNPTFNGTIAAGAAANTDGFGSTFKYTPPDGFKGLSFDNQPDEGGLTDLCWIKNRDTTDTNQWYDSSRGPLLDLETDSTNAESTTLDGLQKFLKNGVEIEDNDAVNTKGEKFVSWNWVAGGGTTSANADGSGATLASQIQTNTTAGFSIITWTGESGSSGGGHNRKIAHGLGATPHFFITKNRTTAGNGSWIVYHHQLSDPSDKILYWHDTNAEVNWPYLNDSDPTSSIINIGDDRELNSNSDNYVAYAWTEIPGFSKFGKYTGSGNTDGPFLYMGFKPKLVVLKQTNTSNYWAVFDSERKNYNPNTLRLTTNYNYAENDTAEGAAGSNAMDFLSNGVKLRGTDTTTNQSGGSYVYAAWAEHPFNGDGSNAFATAR